MGRLRFTLVGVFILTSFVYFVLVPFATRRSSSTVNELHRDLACTTWPQDTSEANLQNNRLKLRMRSDSTQQHKKRSKPAGIKIVGLIFFDRREYTDILDCYLRRNLVANGGYLDEVHFVSNARDPKDTTWLSNLVKEVEGYRKLNIPRRCKKSVAWTGCLWDLASDRSTLYIKMDDDLVYIHEDAISSMVETRLKYKEAFAIGANLINAHLLLWMHFHNSAIHPYLPDLGVKEVVDAKRTWRPSNDPPHNGENLEFKNLKRVNAMRPPFAGHRWLRLNDTGEALLQTPIAAVEWGANNPDLHDSWAVTAQQHYSLLENLEKNQLARYHLGGEDGIWNTQYRQYNLNMMAVWGSDIADHLPFDTDKKTFAADATLLSIDLPRKTGRPILVDSRALAMHFAFRTQLQVSKTDVLDRWRAYANEKICDRPKLPFGPPCKGVHRVDEGLS